MTECPDDPSDIVQRLEKLNKWQEDQKQLLFERQSNQRKLLGLEHKKMCEMLGIYHSTSHSDDLKDNPAVNEVDVNDNTLGLAILDQTKDDQRESSKPPKQQIEQHEEVKGPQHKFLRRKQGLINRFKMDPDQFRLNKLPKYKFSSAHPAVRNKYPKQYKEKAVESPRVPKGVLKLKVDNEPKNLYIDLMEKKFQEALKLSKNACNSTPDSKSQSSSAPLSPVNESPTEPASWAVILDPQAIKPVESPCSRSVSEVCLDESENLTIFQLLEKQAQNESFDINNSCLKEFLRKAQKNVVSENVEPPLPKCLSPHSRNSVKNVVVSASSDSETEVDETQQKVATRVRFADEASVETTMENVSETLDSTDASHLFEEFKRQIFANQNDTAQTTDVNGSALTRELQQKAELIKERLRELESEIAMFKKSNMELTQSKQEHELEKAHFEQERREAYEKLNDERIQMEIYLHDERMKIEDERKKMEKQMRHQRSLSATREKKEMTKLREEYEALQKEMKKNDESHIAVQARVRAHVRNLEKDVRALNGEIEALSKENKRLQAELSKLARENNNKMLHEINRNISKLASKGNPQNITSPPVAADVSDIALKENKSKLSRRKDVDVKRKSCLVKNQSTLRHKSPSPTSDEESCIESANEPDEQHNKSSHVQLTENSIENTKQSDGTETQDLGSDSTFKREIRNADGSTDIIYPNGNLKKISPDGMIIRMLYFNKDIKETNINEGTVKYYYAETNTWHTSYLDGLEILEFPNGQTEHRHRDGKIEIHFPNNTIKISDPKDGNKLEEWRFADGTNLIHMRNGDKILLMPNGQKEIHTSNSKRREYPDGTIKLVYPDGSQETRYSNGRVRLKDKDGNLVMDTDVVNN